MALCCSLYIFYIDIKFAAMENYPLPEEYEVLAFGLGKSPVSIQAG